MEAWVAHEPAMDLRRLVGRDVVDNEVDVEVFWDRAVDQVQKVPELLGAVPGGHFLR